MAFKRHKLYWLLLIVLYLPQYTRGSCEMMETPKEDGLCTALLECEQVISFSQTSWDCIKHAQNMYTMDYYGRRQYSHQSVTYDTKYNLHIAIENANDENDMFENIANVMSNIKLIHIKSGNMFSVPENIYQLSDVTDIEISNNQVSTVNLNRFVTKEMLTSITFRNNSIDTLDLDTEEASQSSRSIVTIDLSRNRLEKLPNTCFSLFTELQHLNLSYNKIHSFDILTFEGVMKLKTLDVSHNMLFEIGSSFTRFINLEELYLQNNKLTKLKDFNLNSLIKLKMLNMSTNIIDTFENNTFKNLLLLEDLDLCNNRIVAISKNLFESNINMRSLLVNNNFIKHIDDGAFDGKNITEFDIKGNNLTGTIEKDYFKGIHVTELDVSTGSITSLGSDAFKYMCQDLNHLNMSANKINLISQTAFSCLDHLKVLDLSHNRIEQLNFETSSLMNLTSLHVHHNKIKKITSYYSNLVSLKTLDLSHNEIAEIELKSFSGLLNIDTLIIMHNPFVNTLENSTFDGLVALTSINLSFTRTLSYENRSFSGLPALKHINASFGQLSNIAYNAFIKTGSIQVLDFSHNLVETFHINTTSIPNVEEIHLNDNLIRHVTNDTFSGLTLLRLLNLANNNIQKMEDHALKNLNKLSHLYLSSNMQIEIIGNPFNNLSSLYQVNMDRVMTKYTFKNGTSIENLDLHSSGINDLTKLSISNVNNLRELNLSDNKIITVDKFSFQSLPFLIKLDLSKNRISFIQPGSFLQVGELRALSLFGNNLQSLHFGVFDGIKDLNYVNLSSNALQSFDAKLLPVAMTIALDNNDISKLNFEDFFQSKVRKLSIGGNRISCKVLAKLKTSNYSEKFEAIVTTAALDFHSENVNGISCQSVPNGNEIILPVANSTGYDFRPLFVQFANAIESLRLSIETLGNNTASEKSHKIPSDIAQLVSSIQALVEISKQTQLKSNDYFNNMEHITNATQTHLGDIKDQLINLTGRANDLKLDHDTSDIKSNGNNDDVRVEIKQMLKDEIDAIREEFGKTFQNLHKSDPISLIQGKESRDDKVMYFIAASLGIILALYAINIAYRLYKREQGLNSLYSSRRPIAGEMEME